MFDLQSLKQKLFTPVDASSVAVFRIGFGLILLWDVWRYFAHDWIGRFYIEPGFYFKYYGFEWVQPWGGDGMYIHFVILGLCATLIIFGAAYRLAVVIFTLAFTYVFLLDQTRYLNHFYLVILFSVLLCVIPAHRCCSVDARLRPKLHSSSLPTWSVWLLRAQMEIMLIYAGLVKINADWLQLEPLRMWLAERDHFPDIFVYLFTQDWSIAVAAYGIIILHIVGAPLLLWKRTRLVVFCMYAGFHTLNHFVFTIGIFPWFTLFGSLIFFDPDWPKQFASRIQRIFRGDPDRAPRAIPDESTSEAQKPLQQNLILVFLCFWVSSQIVIPLRHFLYPGNVSWTEEGHRFSWQMKLRDKQGRSDFFVIDRQRRGNVWHINPHEFLTRKQVRKMSGRPDMILQFAHFLRDYWQHEYSLKDPEVRATVMVSLNGRKPALLIDPEQDLSKIKRNLRHADWILPLNEPLTVAKK
ncbi:HTTM domain-containing protein [Kaarinaea lacus]